MFLLQDDEEDGGTRSSSRMKVEDMYSNLPRSLKAEVLVKVKNEDPAVQKERQELVKTHTPGKLAEFHGISDFPVPSALENIFKGKPEEPEAPPRSRAEKDEAKRE